MPAPVQQYLTLASAARAEAEVSRSRFVCDLTPVDSEQAAREAIDEARSQHRGAGHHCTAFLLGPDGSTARTNDDGEPSGTAGPPMLDVLRGHGLTEVCAVVSRWFGGTLLGTGGLIRAYGSVVTAALENAAVTRYELRPGLLVEADHATGPRVENALRGIRGVGVNEVQYRPTGMGLHVFVPSNLVTSVVAAVAEVSSGSATVSTTDPSWVPVASTR